MEYNKLNKTAWRKLIILFFYFFISFQFVQAQEQLNVKFGKIAQADFETQAPKFDSGSNAVILSDIGKTSFKGNEYGTFSIIFTRFIRVKILNKNGFNIADNRIFLYNDRKGTLEKITDLKGSTFNIEDGKIQETKLDDKLVFKEKYSKHLDIIKFSMPALKVGSVYNLTYTVISNYFSGLPSWTFQNEYPCLWSEYQVTIPSMYHYLLKKSGDGHFDFEKTDIISESYSITRSGHTDQSNDMISIYCPAYQNRWVKKNVPVLKKQPYISTVDNYVSRVSFEYNYYQRDKDSEKYYDIVSWDSVSHFLLISEDFGFELNKDNPWMDEVVKTVTQGSSNQTEEIQRIYRFVRDNFHCSDYSTIYVEKSLKDVFKKRAGNVGELNLLLVAMLRHKNIAADPVILSTRENGIATKDYPLLDEYNYLICIAHSGDKTFKLDASRPVNSFGKLPTYCFNWGARIINDTHSEYLEMLPDSVSENRTTSVMFINDEKGNVSGSLTTVFGDNQSSDIREEIKKTSSKEYFKNIETSYTDIVASNETFDSLDNPDHSLILHYDLDFKDLKSSDILYFNPVLGSSILKNPFTATERLYPVEMPFRMDYTYILSMEIPRGFQVDELPKSTKVNYNENQGILNISFSKTQKIFK